MMHGHWRVDDPGRSSEGPLLVTASKTYLRNRAPTATGVGKNLHTSSTSFAPPNFDEERDEGEIKESFDHLSSAERRQVYVKEHNGKRISWFWFWYGCIAVCLFLGSYSMAYTFFKLQLDNETTDKSSNKRFQKLPPCKPINITAAKEKVTCLPKCKPHATETIEGMQLDPTERTKITTRQNDNYFTGDYGKYRIHFSEENVHLDVVSPQQKGEEFGPRSVTERLFRRIVAKLFRAGVLDPSKNIIDTGSKIGDNALPWSMMLEQLSDNPGKVIAVDPSQRYIQAMARIANTNSISNLCTHIALYSSEERTIFTDTAEHMTVDKFRNEGIEIKATTLDSESLNNVTLMHIDVEGHEADVLAGAGSLIKSSRPVIIIEGGVGNPENDDKVAQILNSLGYKRSSEIPEVCGWVLNCRNYIWWPDHETEAAAMKVIANDLARPVVPWLAFDLPE